MKNANSYIHIFSDDVEKAIEDFATLLPEGMEGLASPQEATSALGLDRLLLEAIGVLSGSGASLLSFFFTLIGLSLLLVLVDKLGGAMLEIASRALTIVTSSVIFLLLLPVFLEVEEVLTDLNSFFTGACAITVSVTAMGGGIASSTAQATSTTLIARLFGAIGSSLSVIVVFLFVLITISVLSGDSSSGLLNLVKGIFGRGMGILVAGLGGFVTLQTVVCGITDSATMRTAKYAIGNLVPVVGGTISGALSTLAGGLEYATGVVGGGAVAVILGLALSPLILLLGYRLCFFIAIFFLELCSCGTGARCLSGFGSILDSLIAVFSLTVVIYLYEVLLFIMGGVFIS